MQNTRRPQWIVFDVSGVLLDWQESATGLAQYLHTDRDTLMEALFRQAPQMNIGIVSAREGWRAVLKTLGKIDENPEKIIHQWRAREYWLADTLILLRELDAAGYSLAILSNSWLGLTDAGERSTFPEEIDLFTYILDSSKEGIKKPDPAFYALAEERISVSGGLIFFIDDDAQNLLPARMRGWQTFHYVLGGDKGLRSNEEVRDMLLGKTKGL